MQEKQYALEGKKLKELIVSKGYSLPSFSHRTYYSTSRLYRLCDGVDDIRTLRVYNAVIFAYALGFRTLDEFYQAIGIDLVKELF